MFYRLLYRLYRIVTSILYWVRRRFTPAGWTVIWGLAVAGGLGLDTTQNVAHQAFTFLFSLVVLAMLVSVWFRAGFAAERALPQFGSVGGTLPYRVMLRNLTAKPQRGLRLLENLADARPSLPEFVAQVRAEEAQTKSFRIGHRPKRPQRHLATVKPQAVPALPPKGQAEVNMELVPLRRGVLRLTGLTVARPDPLGLFQSFATLPLPQTVLILPKRYLLPPVALPGTTKYQQGGVAQASSVGESEEFVSLRDYRPGDPLRHIHWKSWGRLGKPIVKEYQDEFFVRHALILDTFCPTSQSQAFEEAVSVAASFACTIQTQESLLDLMFVGPQAFCFTTGRGLAHTEQMLEILAAVTICQDKSFDALECLVLNHVAVVSGCVILLLAWDEARRTLIKRLHTLGIPMLVLVIVDPSQAAAVENSPAADKPARFHVLEAGKIPQGLARI